MNKKDFIFIAIVLIILAQFFVFPKVLETYLEFNRNHGMITSFIKFGILATFGELIGLRIKEGVYYKKTFGVLPKVIVWGFLGLTIKLAFIVFAVGVPAFIEYLGLNNASNFMSGGLSVQKLGIAFSISVLMNVIYAPVMMLTHKITDSHFAIHNGKLSSLLKSIQMESILNSIDWKVQWGFIFKKTIPLFWIPAHTITFLLPKEFQVLFAALLSVMLGLILAIATLKSEK